MLMYNNNQYYQVDNEGCDPFEWGSAAKAFWEGEFDKSCEEEDFLHFKFYFILSSKVKRRMLATTRSATCSAPTTWTLRRPG